MVEFRIRQESGLETREQVEEAGVSLFPASYLQGRVPQSILLVLQGLVRSFV